MEFAHPIHGQILKYQDKFTRQDGKSLTSHYLRWANLAANQPAIWEEDLVGALTSHYPIAIQRSMISGNIKMTQAAVNLVGKLDALEARDDYTDPSQNSDPQDASRRPQYNSQVDRTGRKPRDSIRAQYVRYTVGSNCDRQRVLVRRIDTTVMGAATVVGWRGEQEALLQPA